MSFPFFRQADSMDCGPTCLQMIAKHYGKNISLQLLRQKTQIGKEGVSLLGISDAAESIGFRTQAVRLSYQTLVSDVQLPCILHWNQSHFIVLHKVKNGSRSKRKQEDILYLADPAIGLVKIPTWIFNEKWISSKNEKGITEGIALLLEPSPAFYDFEEDTMQDIHVNMKLGFINILNYIIPYRKLVLQLLLGLGVESMLQLILPFLAQSVVDVGVNTANIGFVYLVLFAQLAVVCGRLLTSFIRSWILLHISSRINVSILTDFLIKLMKLPLAFFDSKKTGDILQRMNDHQRIESFLTGSSITVLFSLVNLIIFSVVLALFNIYIFSVFIIASLLYSAWVVIFLQARKLLDYRRFNLASKEQGATIQLVQGMQEIKLYGVEKPMRWKWERLQAALFKLNMKSLSLNQWQQLGGSFINEGKNILITFLSAKAVIDGQLTLGTMLAVQYIIGQLNSPIEQMIGFIQNWQNAKISMDRLNEIHQMEDEERPENSYLHEIPAILTKELIGGQNSITGLPMTNLEVPSIFNITTVNDNQDELSMLDLQLCDISFTYPGAGNLPVLNNINLKIPGGKTTAIVGVSGSGKSTLIKLLLKFYAPGEGNIKLNHTLLSTLSHRSWRSHCGAVLQESFIFSDNIANNIAVGKETIDLVRLRHAAHVANIDDYIESLPLGYNTMIGAEGNGISMGQKQRILIARAVYKDPEFIFFDEATNSLDANNERTIIDNLSQFFKGKTVIVVAHRLSTVKNADQIVVLNKGFVKECGTHIELVALKGEYYTLVKNQLELGN